LTFNQKELVSPYHPQIDFITKKWKKKAEKHWEYTEVNPYKKWGYDRV
jgi:hypothetical protein